MKKEELKNLIPGKTMVYRKRDGVGYTFIGVDENGNYKLCGMPAYEKCIMLECFEVR